MGAVDNYKEWLGNKSQNANNAQSGLNRVGGLLNAANQSFSDIVLEAAGLTIPLPSQIEVNDFFKKIKDEQNPLNLKDPNSWTELEYLKWQSLVRKQIAKDKLKKEKKQKPNKLKAYREAQKQKKAEKAAKLDIVKTNPEKQAEAIPQDQVERPNWSKSLLNIGKMVLKFCLPTLFNMAAQAGIDKLQQEKQKLLDKAIAEAQAKGITPLPTEITAEEIENLKSTYCPSPIVLNSLLNQRNGIVEYLNNQQVKIDNITTIVNLTSDTANFLQTTSQIIDLSNVIINQASKAIPLIPGAVVSFMNDLNSINKQLVFESDGTPRIPKLRTSANNISMPLNVASEQIVKIVNILGAFDELIALCNPALVNSLTPLSPSVLLSTATQIIANNTDNGSTYKGFTLEIETRPYTDTVNQNRAVGKNADGIILISTELSFASDPNVLIDELKYLIDRDNLKAY
jgi:hypothetical protein